MNNMGYMHKEIYDPPPYDDKATMIRGLIVVLIYILIIVRIFIKYA